LGDPFGHGGVERCEGLLVLSSFEHPAGGYDLLHDRVVRLARRVLGVAQLVEMPRLEPVGGFVAGCGLA
jgi:hypothetical protein